MAALPLPFYVPVLVPLLTLLGALIATGGTAFWGNKLSRRTVHCLATSAIGISCLLSIITLIAVKQGLRLDLQAFQWAPLAELHTQIGFLVDPLSALMMCIVCAISLLVHIYSIGYMEDDPGANRFFVYISLFTFAMLMLVMSNNTVQLFFGWEAVGLMSYLLIGFWYERPSATLASMKAFIVNRVGDAAFILGLGLLITGQGATDYASIFAERAVMAQSLLPGSNLPLIEVSCICLFIGAMAKSAQMPLHVWLPDSMEGPTPISALIHAATMVTAGIFMVSRFSPLFELAPTARSIMLIVGALTALSMGLVATMQNDIKRVIAFSTLSQLGYMTSALGASAYAAAIFHLLTHAFFKALLFLCAGVVILAMHHDQNIRNMGGLRKHLPWTWATALIGCLALTGLPPFSGLYSKESILEAVRHSTQAGASFAYVALMCGVFITALYTFRWFFRIFYGDARYDNPEYIHHGDPGVGIFNGAQPHEGSWIMRAPLITLCLPAAILGACTAPSILSGEFFQESIWLEAEHASAATQLAGEFAQPMLMAFRSPLHLPLWLILAAAVITAYFYVFTRRKSGKLRQRIRPLVDIIDNDFYFDRFNEIIFAGGIRKLGNLLWHLGDRLLIDAVMVNGLAHMARQLGRALWNGDLALIDELLVNGSSRMVMRLADKLRCLQTGLVHHYALFMCLGLLLMMLYFLPLHFFS